MTSRERVRRAIRFQEPDHVPHHLPDGRKRRVDAWGVAWETMGGGSFGEAVQWPLSDITRQGSYPIPDGNNAAYLADIRAYVRRMIATLGSHRGGLISMAYSTPEAVRHAPEKTAVMCAAFREYGDYGRGGRTPGGKNRHCLHFSEGVP